LVRDGAGLPGNGLACPVAMFPSVAMA
jgi:hypothetical protein